ncbi:hypothetical protein JCM10213_007853 [Rhodosporidiobolus nylandii]
MSAGPYEIPYVPSPPTSPHPLSLLPGRGSPATSPSRSSSFGLNDPGQRHPLEARRYTSELPYSRALSPPPSSTPRRVLFQQPSPFPARGPSYHEPYQPYPLNEVLVHGPRPHFLPHHHSTSSINTLPREPYAISRSESSLLETKEGDASLFEAADEQPKRSSWRSVLKALGVLFIFGAIVAGATVGGLKYKASQSQDTGKSSSTSSTTPARGFSSTSSRFSSTPITLFSTFTNTSAAPSSSLPATGSRDEVSTRSSTAREPRTNTLSSSSTEATASSSAPADPPSATSSAATSEAGESTAPSSAQEETPTPTTEGRSSPTVEATSAAVWAAPTAEPGVSLL